MHSIVSFAAVFRVVTQRFSPINAFRDDLSNGCEREYTFKSPFLISLSFLHLVEEEYKFTAYATLYTKVTYSVTQSFRLFASWKTY